MTNVYVAPLFQGDPCTWYIINFLLDSTIGLFIIYVGIRICQFLAKRNKWDAINFGEYSKYLYVLFGVPEMFILICKICIFRCTKVLGLSDLDIYRINGNSEINHHIICTA